METNQDSRLPAQCGDGLGDKQEMQLQGASGEMGFSREESRGKGLGT